MSKYRIECQATPLFLPDQSDTQSGLYGFAYTVTITNTGDVTAQLISRHWYIEDATGKVEEVKGLGVVGYQPLLQSGQSFQYSSGCRLRTPSGLMHGSYFCVAEDGERFETPIPAFVLSSGSSSLLH